VVAGTWGSAAGCLCRERLGEGERTLYLHITHISENIRRKFPKMGKMTKNTQKLTKK
jgi:hypothetical protein